MSNQNRVITINGKALSDSANRITKLMALVPDVGTGTSIPVMISCSSVGDRVPVVMYSSYLGMICRTSAGFAKVVSPVPVTEFAISPELIQALGSSTESVELTLTNDGYMSYRKAGLRGKVALCDPSSIPFVTKPQGLTLADFDFNLIKDLLNVTSFTSLDPRLASVGPVTHVVTSTGFIQVSTYDSMSAIVARKQQDHFKPGYEFVIPNRTLLAMVTHAAKDVVKVGYDENVYHVRSQTTEATMPKADYPAIDVAKHIQATIEESKSSFQVNGAEFYQAMERISGIAKVDKDVLSVEVKYNSSKGHITIDALSAKATATAAVKVYPTLKQDFSAMFDYQRLTSFTKAVSKVDRFDVYYGGQRMIFVTPNVTYAFPGS